MFLSLDTTPFYWSPVVTPPAPFSVLNLPGLTTWLKADGTLWQLSSLSTPAVADGDPVGAWVPSGGTAGNWLQATAGNRFTLKTNIRGTLPALRMVPNQTLALASAITAIGDFSLFVAGAIATSNSHTDSILLGTHSSTQFLLDFTADGQNFNPVAFKTNFAQANILRAGWFFGAWSLWEIYRSGSTFEFISNGASLGANTTSSTAFTLQDFNGLDTVNFYCSADVGEMILCKSFLADGVGSNRRQTRSYLQNRWGTPQ